MSINQGALCSKGSSIFQIAVNEQRLQKVKYRAPVIESLVTIGIISAHVLFFVLIAKYFPIFEHHPEAADYTIPDHFRKIEKHDKLGTLGSEA